MPVEIAGDLESMMPGRLLVSENYILWTDPFHSDKYIHILNKETGEEIGQMLSVGNGPDELITPNASVYPDDKIVAFDFNANKRFSLSIDSALQQTNYILQKQTGNYKTTTSMIALAENEYISLVPSEKEPFLYLNEGTGDSYSFGSFPVEEAVNNSSGVFQGSLAWSPTKNCLVYSIFRFPYMAVYKRNMDKFEIAHTYMPNTDYQIVEGDFRYNNSEGGIQELAITSEYILTIQRDRKFDQTDDQTVGRDFNKLPHTVFLYNYELQLVKIIDLGMPLLRLAADPLSNTVYAIGINPDFVLVKFEI
ncbi:MAG: hypothetical protein LBK65_08380 [Tannerellaceae bacterium]|nr:hypothetical protein [Tannerellaceae bacterium]